MGAIPFVVSVEVKRGNQIVRVVPLYAVTITVLATMCFLACVFYVCVLFQSMRNTKAKTTLPAVADNEDGESCEKKRPYIVGSRRAAERDDPTTFTSVQVPSIKE